MTHIITSRSLAHLVLNIVYNYLPWHCSPWWTMAPSLSRLHNRTQTHSLGRATLDERSNTQQTDIHVHGRIRTRNPSQRAAADLFLRTSGSWDRSSPYNTGFNVDPASGFRVSRDALCCQSVSTYLRCLAPLVFIVINKKFTKKF
jgi:hypothetical protein